MAINVKWIARTHEKLHFLCCSARGPSSVICKDEIFIKLNLPILLVLVGQQEKSLKYFSLSAFNWNWNQINKIRETKL